ncbi:alanyl-tRNA editing protein [Rhabdaerophilum calidifontis]|uniref:alanyl-tRNA editing protein n=1 Tax=Rhabdaerophilum calidifontis TaxID=2604328 RepID=UPI001FE83234|nr:alanyl-tRNA editing protein [Rhabdaerophilum calidifontis]
MSAPPAAPDLPATRLIFREDAYADAVEAEVIALHEGMLVLDRTLFYAASGGQPSDTGTIMGPDGQTLPLAGLRYLDAAKTVIGHALPEGADAAALLGARLTLRLDFARRHRLMRMHTALHLLSVVLPYPVTGGAISEEESRLDFDIPDAGLDRDEISARLNALIATDAEVRDRWITEAELDANPGLVKTMSVKPPRGAGRVRLVEIAEPGRTPLDLQPCGGTHVRATGEIGRIGVTQIEKKGKQNRRVRIAFA